MAAFTFYTFPITLSTPLQLGRDYHPHLHWSLRNQTFHELIMGKYYHLKTSTQSQVET